MRLALPAREHIPDWLLADRIGFLPIPPWVALALAAALWFSWPTRARDSDGPGLSFLRFLVRLGLLLFAIAAFAQRQGLL